MFDSKFKYPIAIDMSGGNIYATQLRRTQKGPVIRGLFNLEGPWDIEESNNNGKALESHLKEIANDRRFSGKRALLHLPSRDISSFPIRIQLEDSETLEEAILRESKEYISFPLDEAIIDYPSLVSINDDEILQYKATIIATHRDYIDKYLQLFKSAGIIVEGIDFDVSSLIRLHRYLFTIPDNPIILCNIDHNQSLIAVITNDAILAERHISWGFDHLKQKVQSNLELTQDEYKTEALLKKYGLTNNGYEDNEDGIDGNDWQSMHRAIYQIIMPDIEDLIDEFHKITIYLRSEERGSRFEKIYFYGMASFINGLDSYFEKHFNISVELVDPMTGFALEHKNMLSDKTDGAPFGLAIGLALRRVPWL